MHMVPVNNTHERYVVFQYWPISEWRVKQMNPGPWHHGEKEYRAWAWLIEIVQGWFWQLPLRALGKMG